MDNINASISKFEEIITQIKKNKVKLNAKSLEKLADETYQNLASCYQIDDEILSILNDKTRFSSILKLNSFVKDITGFSSSKRKREDAEIENTKLIVSKGITAEELKLKVPSKPVKVPKRKTISKPKKIAQKIPDMGQTWLKLNEEALRREFTKYSDSKDLKQAASSLLKGNDRRLRNREKIETRILERIRDRKALFQLGL